MRKQRLDSGFSAIELLITLFVAAAFLIAGYQLYNLIIKDGGKTRAEARASNVAYDYLRRYSNSVTQPCNASTPVNSASVSVNGLSAVSVTVVVSCPYSGTSGTNNGTNVSKVEATVNYNTPQKSVKYSTFVAKASSTATADPTAPTNLVATASSISQMNTTWVAPSSYTPTSYTLQYADNSAFNSPTTITGINSLSQVVTGLNASTTYYFHVQAVGSAGTSPYTSTVSAATYNAWSAYTLITGVGDWNGDGNNDLVGYTSSGDLKLHLGNGNASFGPAILLTNIGTAVRNLMGPGKPLGATAPTIFWVNNNTGPAYTLFSNGGTGISGSPIATSTTNWISYDSVFTVPKYYSDGRAAIIGKINELYIYSLNSAGAVTYLNQYGSGWLSAYPGDRVFGAGDFSGDGIGDIAGINSSGTMYLYYGTGTGTTGSAPNIGSGWTSDRVMGGWDYNNDGKADMLRYFIPTSTLGFYGGNGAAGYVTPYNTTIN